MAVELGDVVTQIDSDCSLGVQFIAMGKFSKAKECLRKAYKTVLEQQDKGRVGLEDLKHRIEEAYTTARESLTKSEHVALMQKELESALASHQGRFKQHGTRHPLFSDSSASGSVSDGGASGHAKQIVRLLETLGDECAEMKCHDSQQQAISHYQRLIEFVQSHKEHKELFQDGDESRDNTKDKNDDHGFLHHFDLAPIFSSLAMTLCECHDYAKAEGYHQHELQCLSVSDVEHESSGHDVHVPVKRVTAMVAFASSVLDASKTQLYENKEERDEVLSRVVSIFTRVQEEIELALGKS
jgi:hypothetical protein